MVTIKGSFSVSGLEEIKSKLISISENLNKASELISHDMAEFSSDLIKTNYNSSPYTDGNDDISFIKETKEKKTIVGVRGTQVLYREFGTGTEGLNAPHPIKGEFALKGYNTGPSIRVNSKNGDLFWIYKDAAGNPIYTQGIPAGKEVYNASILLKGKKISIIKKRVGEALSKH